MLLQIGIAVSVASVVLTCPNEEFIFSSKVFIPDSWYSMSLHCIQQQNLLGMQLCSLRQFKNYLGSNDLPSAGEELPCRLGE